MVQCVMLVVVHNFAGGYIALTSNTTGYNNVAIRKAAMRMNVSGINNIALGQCALALNTSWNQHCDWSLYNEMS